jgi:hypothetical protein
MVPEWSHATIIRVQYWCLHVRVSGRPWTELFSLLLPFTLPRTACTRITHVCRVLSQEFNRARPVRHNIIVFACSGVF